jgi:hypothetical protein
MIPAASPFLVWQGEANVVSHRRTGDRKRRQAEQKPRPFGLWLQRGRSVSLVAYLDTADLAPRALIGAVAVTTVTIRVV